MPDEKPRSKPRPYPGDLKREPHEFDLHYCYRWVATLKKHPKEPRFLLPFRAMLAKDPGKFFTNYAVQQARYDRICTEAEAEAQENGVEMAPCEQVVKQLLDEWDKVA